jgi:hypothetical protein
MLITIYRFVDEMRRKRDAKRIIEYRRREAEIDLPPDVD